MTTKRLPETMPVPDARRTDVSTCMSPEERQMFDAIAGGGSVFAWGTPPQAGPDAAVVKVNGQQVVVPGGGQTARRMVREGWFRFAESPVGMGFFWFTESGDRVHRFGKRS